MTKQPKNENEPARKNRFVSFGLKSMLIMLCVAAVGINYWRHSVVQTESLKTLQACGAEWVFSHEMDEDFDYLSDPWPKAKPRHGVRSALRFMLGSSFVDRVACVRMIEKGNFASIRPTNPDRQPHQSEAWIALRKLNRMSPLQAVAVEVNTKEQLEILSDFDSLKYLQVVCYSHDSMEMLARLPNLETLELATRSPELDWISEISRIRNLHVRKVLPAPRLTIDVNFLTKMPQLETLEFRAVELRNTDSISSLKNLAQLGLVHTDVESIKPFSNLNLQTVWLNHSRINQVDGMATIESLETLDLRDTQILKADVVNLKRKLKESGSQCEVLGTGIDPE